MSPPLKPTLSSDGVIIDRIMDYSFTEQMSKFEDECTIKASGYRREFNLFKIGSNVVFTYGGISQSLTITRRDVTTQDSGEIHVAFSGKDSVYTALYENPEEETFVNKTDDDIIGELAGGFGLVSDGPVTMKKYTTNANDKTFREIQRVAAQNGFNLWANGNTIFKQRIASEGSPSVTYFDNQEEPVPSGNYDFEMKVLKYTQDINHCVKQVQGYGKDDLYKHGSSDTNVNLTLIDGSDISSAVQGTARIKMNAKTAGEKAAAIEGIKRKSSPTQMITIKVRGIDSLELNSTARLKLNLYDVDAVMVLYKKTYNIGDNTTTTDLHFTALGSHV